MKDEYDNENLLFYQPHMIQLVLMKYVNMHSMHRSASRKQVHLVVRVQFEAGATAFKTGIQITYVSKLDKKGFKLISFSAKIWENFLNFFSIVLNPFLSILS